MFASSQVLACVTHTRDTQRDREQSGLILSDGREEEVHVLPVLSCFVPQFLGLFSVSLVSRRRVCLHPRDPEWI